MNKETGGTAFPSETAFEYTEGMSLRDYFAAKAMQALTQRGERHLATIAQDSYEMADAMLKARES